MCRRGLSSRGSTPTSPPALTVSTRSPMTREESIIELGTWLQTAPGRYLLDWEQLRLDSAVTDAFGFHALQLGLPELDGLRANRMPYRWGAIDSLTAREASRAPA